MENNVKPVYQLFQHIPNVHDCLGSLAEEPAVAEVPAGRLKNSVRQYLEVLRQRIREGSLTRETELTLEVVLAGMIPWIVEHHKPRFRRVINATGVIVHTNLGRSLLPKETMQWLYQAGSHYANLEFDLDTGERGSRYSLVEEILCELTGAEAALVVNNNAAAVLLALDTLAKGKEAIVSRGQLVEIGGSFRIPDVMQRSGARLVEVGATNRTHLRDYEAAIGAETSLLLKVHCSNFRVIGFTSEVSNAQLVALGRSHGVPVMEDLGSGCLVDLSPYGLEREPTVPEVVQAGLDVVTFSGDKLLGGPQAGMILGRRAIISKIKRNPLTRALRIDKFTLAALESILRMYLDPRKVMEQVPTLKMIAAPAAEINARARATVELLAGLSPEQGTVEIVPVVSRVGGGALPEQNLESAALCLTSQALRASEMERRLRTLEVPVICRIEDDRLLFDMRTVGDDELELLAANLLQVVSHG
ncbi:MAG: L-seryl-tRNA(Sec) selenium transferase [Desulfobulbus propionicus]|nr:MAG: L-seryl-tRNA(Sec) selenium transferase [Desulfobulbus propionicus]